ncbi:homeodomain-like protein [Tanacetum coccineum]
MATPFANPERQFRTRRDTSLAPIHNIYTFYESESSESESKDVASEALKSIQVLTDHSHKWHNEESKNTLTPFGIIAKKLKALNHEMDELRVDVRKINTNEERKSLHEEIKSIRTSEISYNKSSPKSNIYPTNLKDTFEYYLKESCKRQDFVNEWMKKFIINTEINLKNHYSSIKRLEENVNHLVQLISTHNLTNQECAIKLKPAREKPTLKVETFAEKVRRHILKENVFTFKLNARCSAILQNELPPKEKDPGSLILPCAIGTTTISNALADLGASISIMPFSLFKRSGLGNPKPINMVIEMVDRSMQSPKGIVENVLVQINKFIFPVDFIILDIVEDDKVPIILGRPMLATAHTRIDVFGKKISLEVGTKQITFDIKERESPFVISSVCVINNLSEVNKFDEHRDLEELLLSDDDLGIFPNDNDLSPNLENYDTMFLSPPGSARLNDDSSEMFCNPNSNSCISMDDFVEMDDVWDNLDFRDLANEATKFPVKPEFLSRNNMVGFAKNLHVFIRDHQFLIDFIILVSINEFVEKGLTEVLFGQPFKEHVGIIKDRIKGVLWFKIRDDKTIFNMPYAKKRFAFVEANYEALKTLFRDQRRQVCNEEVRAELEYSSEEYDEEMEMEPRPTRTTKVTFILRIGSLHVRRLRGVEGGGIHGVNLPPFLVAHLGTSENRQPLQSTLTFEYGGNQPSTIQGGNLPPTANPIITPIGLKEVNLLSEEVLPTIPTWDTPAGFNDQLWHIYTVSSLMDTVYWLSEKKSSKYLRLSSRMRAF